MYVQLSIMSLELFYAHLKIHLGPSINDITHLGGRGICQKVKLFHKPIYVKWVTRGGRGQKSQKMGDIIYGRSLIGFAHITLIFYTFLN